MQRPQDARRLRHPPVLCRQGHRDAHELDSAGREESVGLACSSVLTRVGRATESATVAPLPVAREPKRYRAGVGQKPTEGVLGPAGLRDLLWATNVTEATRSFVVVRPCV